MLTNVIVEPPELGVKLMLQKCVHLVFNFQMCNFLEEILTNLSSISYITSIKVILS